MCASCKCGCKPGKPAKGCDCQCKECRAARESVSKSGILISVDKRDSSKWRPNSAERRAVSNATLRDKDYWKFNAGAAGGYAAGGAGALYLARKGKPKAALGALGAGVLAGLPLDIAAGRAKHFASNKARRDMGLPERTQFMQRQVGKSLAELGGVAKAAPFGSLSNPFKGIGALKPVGDSVKRRVANNAAAASVARKPRFKDSSVSPFKDMSNPLRRIS